ncbi:MAG TPA: CorA family divalent cation transporter [Candidatus Limnocylindrales bacterium]|nr:CorA family divalent cation transporter [Candidatus Limnocylindrales bacterium]
MRARRFDADREDRILSLEEALTARPSQRQLLWIDITGEIGREEAERLADGFSLDARTRRSLEVTGEDPSIAIHGEYFRVRLAAEPGDMEPGQTPWLEIVAGRNVVISRHLVPLQLLSDFDDRIEADATLGELSSATFVASLLDAVITSYHHAVDAIEDEVDALDAKSLKDDGRDPLPDLVALRRRIARLRRLLTDHRSLFASLASPDIAAFSGDPDGAAALRAVTARFEGAIAAVEDSREVLLGSFDVYMTRTAQRTNEVMKVLALATVLLLPGSLVAGLLGMNVTVPLSKDDPTSFWIVALGVAAFAIAIVVVARARRWL